MESLEISAKTVEEAIQRALEQLGMERDEVEVTVVRESKPGIFGIGADEAVVRVTPLVPVLKGDIAEAVRGVIEKLLALMGVVGSVTSQTQPALEPETSVSVAINIVGDDLGLLIGRQGQTLSCLQYIVKLIIGYQRKAWVPIIIDAGGYKERRYQALQAFARQMAELVESKNTPFAFKPMPADERRLIHLALADHPNVVTESIGEGESRRVVISRKRNEPKSIF